MNSTPSASGSSPSSAEGIEALGLRGKTALITGGGAGIGRSIAEAFARLGARVVIAEIDAARATAVREELTARGAECLVSVTDARDRGQVEQLLREVDRRYGELDVLVNNVGDFLFILKPFEQTTEDDWPWAEACQHCRVERRR